MADTVVEGVEPVLEQESVSEEAEVGRKALQEREVVVVVER